MICPATHKDFGSNSDFSFILITYPYCYNIILTLAGMLYLINDQTLVLKMMRNNTKFWLTFFARGYII